MKSWRAIAPATLAALAVASSAFAQTATDLNEGSRLEYDAANAWWRLKWWGRQGHTYFIQSSQDLQTWNWLKEVISGSDLPEQLVVTSSGDRFFVRLRHTDVPTTDPEGDDFDGDGVPNLYEITNGFDPFGIVDTNSNGMPDEWELFNSGKFAIWPPTLSATLPRNETSDAAIYLHNDTATPVGYSVVLSGNLGPSYGSTDSVTGSVSYTWEEISTTGTRLETVSDADDGTEPVDFGGFLFPYYGNSFTRVHVSSNGLLMFGAADAAPNDQALPSFSAPANLVAPFWDDLDTRTIGDIYFKEEADRLIVQYENVGRYSGGTSSAYTFQVVLFADGRIQFRYKDMDGVLYEATVGIQDSTRTLGLQMVHDASYVEDEMAVEISPQSSFLSVSANTGIVPAHTTTTLDATFRSLQLPFGSHTATVTISHDAAEVAGPHTATATLQVVNTPGSVELTSPAADTEILEGGSLALIAAATDPEGLDKLEFYSGATKLGEILRDSEPGWFDEGLYEWAWLNPPAGTHILTARAVDVFGGATVSAPVSVTVLADVDGDLMPDAWEETNFGNIDDEASADFDGDGFPNIFEHRHGTSPSDPDDHPQFSTEQTGSYKYYIVDTSLSADTDFEKRTIWGALYGANDFDVIEVKEGTYPESLSLSKRLYLFSSDGARRTVVEGTGSLASILTVWSESVVAGLTLRNLAPPLLQDGGAININVPGPHNKPRVVGCLITGNEVTRRGGGVVVNAGSPAFISCTIAGNYAPAGAGIFNVPSTNQVRLVNTLLWNPAASGPDLGGEVAGFSQSRCLSRDPVSGAVQIDGTPLATTDAGLASDWALTHDSPARDAGAGAEFARRDADGEVPPFGDAPDIGADEFVDIDDDRLPDWWEMEWLVSLDPSWDDDSEVPEADGLNNLFEYRFGLDPTQTDTVGNGQGDLFAAVFSDKRAPWYPAAWKADSDGDGLTDGEELYYGTDPWHPDTNGDGVLDGVAAQLGLDPNDADPDGDTLTNAEEAVSGTNPFLWDTDGDGAPDQLDAFPLDPSRSAAPSGDPGDTTPPTIQLTTPEEATEL